MKKNIDYFFNHELHELHEFFLFRKSVQSVKSVVKNYPWLKNILKLK